VQIGWTTGASRARRLQQRSPARFEDGRAHQGFAVEKAEIS
jgi:hypothetical protein